MAAAPEEDDFLKEYSDSSKQSGGDAPATLHPSSEATSPPSGGSDSPASEPASAAGAQGETGARPARNTVDLADDALLIDISDALSERDKVKFTVHTKTTLSGFRANEFSVVRLHEEFVWLHDRFEESEEYAGCMIPPAPPRPDFDQSREKLQRLGEAESSLTHEEFLKMKAELEQEYLATFKKTVAMHEVFLQRLAQHPMFRNDLNFRVFLEYDGDLTVRLKNKKETLVGFVKSVSKNTDEIWLANTQKDVDDYFERQKTFLLQFHSHLRDSTGHSDRLSRAMKNLADSLIPLSTQCLKLGETVPSLDKFLQRLADYYEKSRKVENRVSSDLDLKLSDSLRYYMRDTQAAKNLLYRRSRSLADLTGSNRNLERARQRQRELPQAESAQQLAQKKFETVSGSARMELEEFSKRRIPHMRKNLVSLAELEAKHAKMHIQLLKQSVQALKEVA